MSTDLYPLLTHINTPHDLRKLDKSQLVDVADELRQYLINTISQCGGHFAAGLGTVELTVALHYMFETPEDRIVWDVGHQAYPASRAATHHTSNRWPTPFPGSHRV